jgi:hypothetical protein
MLGETRVSTRSLSSRVGTQIVRIRMAMRSAASSSGRERRSHEEIIIATDGSSHAQEAVAFGLELAAEQEAE